MLSNRNHHKESIHMFTDHRFQRILVLVAAAFVMSCSSAQTPPCGKNITAANFFVEVSRGSCMGSCPNYTARIDGAGTITVDARAATPFLGTGTGMISGETVCQLVERIAQADVYARKDDYMAQVADAPRTTLTVVMGGKRKKIVWDIAPPKELAALAKYVDEISLYNKDVKVVAAP